MILKMKKYSFLLHHKNYEDFLREIREIGVLHIIEKKGGIGENEELSIKNQISIRLNQVIRKLNPYVEGEVFPAAKVENGLDLLEEAEFIFDSIEQAHLKLQQTERERERMEVWGKFSHQRIAQLKDAGFDLYFYQVNLRKFDQEWEAKYNLFEIDTTGALRTFVVVVPKGQAVEIDAEEVKLGAHTAAELDDEISKIKADLVNLQTKQKSFAQNSLSEILKFKLLVEGDADLIKVHLHTDSVADNHVKVIEGWCPEDKTQALDNYLNTAQVYHQVAEPQVDEATPVKLKNGKFARMYESIGELYDLPNYHELDLTPFFAPFYLLFFGLCLGDAAYGLLVVLGALLMMRKAKPAMKSILRLAVWLGSSTVLMGIVSSTFFGFNLLELDWAILEPLKNVKLFGQEFSLLLNPDQLFNTALVLGAIQIIFGMMVKAYGLIRRFGLPAALSTIGWLILIFGMGGTYLYGLMNPETPADSLKLSYTIILALGGLLVLVLNNVKRNPLINIGSGIWDVYNMATGVLGDLLSYIRLFALGISGSVMGFVFNDLAINMSGDIPVLSTIVMIVIMLIGHGINIFMAGLGAFVHPMRLTFVEFYKNAGFEGGGKKYKPFKIND